MMATPTVALTHCHLLDTGYCLARESTMIQGGRREHVACHALIALLHHPSHGWILWDTGYAPHMLTETARLPYRFYRWATPLRLDPALAVAAQLARFGLQPSSIKTIIISHFHADHIAGLRDFPIARFVATQAAYDHFVARTGLAALRLSAQVAAHRFCRTRHPVASLYWPRRAFPGGQP